LAARNSRASSLVEVVEDPGGGDRAFSVIRVRVERLQAAGIEKGLFLDRQIEIAVRRS
jgi:hypothetical protein